MNFMEYIMINIVEYYFKHYVLQYDMIYLMKIFVFDEI